MALARSPEDGQSINVFAHKNREFNRKGKDFKCSAGEGLSVYAVITHFVQKVLIPQDLPQLKTARAAYVALSNLIDCFSVAS